MVKEKVEYGWTRLPKLPNKGPKLGKALRHDIKRLFHELHDKAMLLRAVDPSFEQELDRLGFTKPLELIARANAMNTKGRGE